MQNYFGNITSSLNRYYISVTTAIFSCIVPTVFSPCLSASFLFLEVICGLIMGKPDVFFQKEYVVLNCRETTNITPHTDFSPHLASPEGEGQIL